MGMASTDGEMQVNIKVTGKKTRLLVMECISGLMVGSMKDSG